MSTTAPDDGGGGSGLDISKESDVDSKSMNITFAVLHIIMFAAVIVFSVQSFNDGFFRVNYLFSLSPFAFGWKT